MKCRDCKHWGVEPREYDRIVTPEDPDTYEPMDPSLLAFKVNRCDNPALHRFERPTESNGFAVNDGSEYFAALYTGEDFGCVRFEPKDGNEFAQCREQEKP